jgi:hypothetical protein
MISPRILDPDEIYSGARILSKKGRVCKFYKYLKITECCKRELFGNFLKVERAFNNFMQSNPGLGKKIP